MSAIHSRDKTAKAKVQRTWANRERKHGHEAEFENWADPQGNCGTHGPTGMLADPQDPRGPDPQTHRQDPCGTGLATACEEEQTQ